MSKLDRIKWSNELVSDMRIQTHTDWTYTQSDHCAVIVKLRQSNKRKFDHIVRLDTFFLSNVLLKYTDL